MDPARPLILAHISDLHFGDADEGLLRAAQAALNALQPDCIVATGDITQSGRRREFAAAAAWFDGLESPVVACPGNHDAPVFALHRRFTQPFARFQALNLPAAWTDAQGRAAIHTFNSARAAQARWNWSHGAYRQDDIAKALAWTKAAAPQGWRILACHHPPRTPKGSPLAAPTKGGPAALRRLEEAPRTLLLCGHVHAPTAEPAGQARILTAPTLASPRRRGHGNGFRVLRLFPETLTVETWTADQAGFGPVSEAQAA